MAGLSRITALDSADIPGPCWRSLRNGIPGESGLAGYVKQGTVLECGVHCSLTICCLPLGEGDWFIAYIVNWCLCLHCLHWVGHVMVQAYVTIFLYRTWVCKPLFPFRPRLVRFCSAGNPSRSVLPVVGGKNWLKFWQSSWHSLW